MYTINLAIIVLVVPLQRGFFGNGFSCYECRSVSASSSGQCISDATSANECEKKYCTIYRQEYLDPVGKIKNFYRSCEDTPSYLNAVIQAKNYKAYYRACNENLCNVGDGLVPFANTLDSKNSNPATEIFIVPGIGSSGDRPSVLLNELIIIISAIVMLLLLQQQYSG